MFLQGKLTGADYDQSLFDLAKYEMELCSILYDLEIQEFEIMHSMQGKENLYD